MKRLAVLLGILMMISCQKEETLQQYMVEKSKDPEFVSFDLSPSLLNLKDEELSDQQKRTMEAFRKVNVLAYMNDSLNKNDFSVEQQKVKTMLKDEKYQELMHVSKGVNGGSISYIGTDEKIDEFIFYASEKKHGFAVIRVIGDDMDSQTMMDLISLFQQSDIQIEALKPLKQLMEPTPFTKH